MRLSKKSLFLAVNSGLLLCCLAYFSNAAAQTPSVYEKQDEGIKLTGPSGWYMVEGDKVKNTIQKNVADMTQSESIRQAVKQAGMLVVFFKYPFGSPREFNPNVSLVREAISAEQQAAVKNALDVARSSVIAMKMMFKDVVVEQEPVAVTVGGREGAHYVYQGTMVRGYLEIRIKSGVYMLIKDNFVYYLVFTDKADDFTTSVAAFQSSLNTFEIK